MTDFGRVRRLFYRDGESLSEISKKTGFRQRLLKQVAGRGMFAFRSHQKLTEICKKSKPLKHEVITKNQLVANCSGRTSYAYPGRAIGQLVASRKCLQFLPTPDRAILRPYRRQAPHTVGSDFLDS